MPRLFTGELYNRLNDPDAIDAAIASIPMFFGHLGDVAGVGTIVNVDHVRRAIYRMRPEPEIPGYPTKPYWPWGAVLSAVVRGSGR
jgi:hypothetical protein